MTHISIEARAAAAIERATNDTNSVEGLDAIERVIDYMGWATGFQVDSAIASAHRKLANKRSQIMRLEDSGK